MSTTPAPPNTTCDIYHNGGAPPDPPDVAGAAVFLQGQFRNIKPVAAGAYTHVMHVPIGTDVRFTAGDAVYVPNQSGTKFSVAFVQRVRAGGGYDFKEVYLLRQAVNWPSNDL